MSKPSALLQPPTNPRSALALSHHAKPFLASHQKPGLDLPYPLSLLTPESQEKWASYENIFLAALRIGNFNTAYLALETLTTRFGKLNERIMALQGLYQEATAKDEKELEEVLVRYDEIIKEDPTVFSVRKRKAALLRSMGRVSEAMKELGELLDASPTDAEAWAELGDCYFSQGMFEQAVFCLEEVLLVMPNAWNIHAKLGEIVYISASKMEAGGEQNKALSESMRRFCRSIELCDDYLRGYYGLKLTTGRLLQALQSVKKPPQASSDPVTGDLAPPSVAAVKKLDELATKKLGEIVRRAQLGEKGWDGYGEAELKAARELLDKGTQQVQR